MEVVNKKVFLVLIMFGIFFTFFIYQNISDNRTELEEVFIENDVKNSSMFAIMLEQEDEDGNSTYIESSDNIWPIDYKYNSLLSGCLDQNGINVPDALSYDAKTKKAIVKTKGVTYCYLYFDKDKSVYAKVVSDYANNNGVSKTSSTSAETGNNYDVYYYTGNITNNNIIYGDYCWKMVITTENQGVKLLYNGVPTEADDGTKTCNNTGTASQLASTKAFNSKENSLAYVGYMYNTVYNNKSKGFTASTTILSSQSSMTSSSRKYYFGDIDEDSYSNGTYTLKNAKTYDSWSTDYADAVGKYTCRSTSSSSCSGTIYYVAATTSSYMYYYAVSSGNLYDDYKIKFSTQITDNGDGTYTLQNPTEVGKNEWYANYSTYENNYYCGDLTSTTCSNMHYATSPSPTSLKGINANNYIYGNSFEDTNNDGVYELTNTKSFWNWPSNYNALSNNHYTCFNTTGECSTLYYIYYTGDSTAYYITLTGGKTVEDAIDEMLYADNVNTTDSIIKGYIDDWYEEAILDKTDTSGNLYSDYLENAIFCNNRAMKNESTNGWNPNGGSTSTYMYFNYNSLECENKNDRFTLGVEYGGTEGYGNNALKYPIGLMSYYEARLASSGTSTYYIESGQSYWLLSPYHFYSSSARGSDVLSSGSLYYYDVDGTIGVRPAVSLSSSVEITSGDGSVTLPYQVELSE